MKYKTYRLNMERCFKACREAGFKADKGERGLQQAMRYLSRLAGQAAFKLFIDHKDRRFMLSRCGEQALQGLDYQIQSEEHWWLTSGRLMYYPESLELARSMLRASSTIADAAAFYAGDEVFMLNLPDGLTLAGGPAVGILVAVCQQAAKPDHHILNYSRWLGLEGVEIAENGPERGAYSIAINYQHPDDHPQVYQRCVLDAPWLAPILRCKTSQDYADFMNANSEFDRKTAAPLNAGDLAYQFQTVRLVLNFLLYKKAMPHRIRDGLPGLTRKEVETAHTMKRTHLIVGMPEAPPRASTVTALTRTPHYRSWHFRQLKDPRYYRGEYEGDPIGSRVVMVSDTYIGKASPKTVEEN